VNARQLRELAVGLQSGISLPNDTPQHPMMSDILQLARETGAPKSRLLLLVADALDENEGLRREVSIAATAARHSAVVLSALPIVTALASALFGVDAIGFLVIQPAGWVCLVVGVGATLAGWRWMAQLRGRVTVPALETGVLVDCVAEVLSVTGLTPDATELVARSAERWGVVREWDEVRSIREVGRNTGIPVANLLRSRATELRRAARFDVRGHIEELPGKLLVPLGLCLFPAFITLTVIPAIASMAQGFFRQSN
jgi:tight adherence protein B